MRPGPFLAYQRAREIVRILHFAQRLVGRKNKAASATADSPGPAGPQWPGPARYGIAVIAGRSTTHAGVQRMTCSLRSMTTAAEPASRGVRPGRYQAVYLP